MLLSHCPLFIASSFFHSFFILFSFSLPPDGSRAPGTIYLCWLLLYMQHLLTVCPSWERDPSSVAPPQVSFIFFSPLLKVCLTQYGRFFLNWIEGLRTEDVVLCTNCKAHWGNVILILGYINKTDLKVIWLFIIHSCVGIMTNSSPGVGLCWLSRFNFSWPTRENALHRRKGLNASASQE